MSISVCSKCGKRNRVDVTKWRSGTTPICRMCGTTLSLPNSIGIGSTARAFGINNVAIWIRKSIKNQIQMPILLTIAFGLSVFSIDHFISKYKNNFDLYSSTLLFESSTGFLKGLAFIKFEGKWYLVNANGKIISKETFDDVRDTSGDFFPVEKNGKWGFLDPKGNLIIDYLYDSCFAACTFRNSLALVKVGNRYGYINPKNEFVINPQFDDAFGFRDDGLAWVRISDMQVASPHEVIRSLC
jgi:hypothetical protein